MVFSLGMSCALCAGKEHRALRSMGFNSQISWRIASDGQRYFVYREDAGLKTNKGGIIYFCSDVLRDFQSQTFFILEKISS